MDEATKCKALLSAESWGHGRAERPKLRRTDCVTEGLTNASFALGNGKGKPNTEKKAEKLLKKLRRTRGGSAADDDDDD
jgi:hypothetical protein